MQVDRDNMTARVSYKFQHTAIPAEAAAAAAAAGCEAAAVKVFGTGRAPSGSRRHGGTCTLSSAASRSSSCSSTRREQCSYEAEAGSKIENSKSGSCGLCWCCLFLLLRLVLPLPAASCAAACCGGIAAGHGGYNSAAALARRPSLRVLVRVVLAFFASCFPFLSLVAAHPHFPPQFRRRRSIVFTSHTNTHQNHDGKGIHFFNRRK